MSALLLGLPLERALRELAERGATQVTVNRLLAPRRGVQAPGEGRGQWRVVRAGEGKTMTLDACWFAEGSENNRAGGD